MPEINVFSLFLSKDLIAQSISLNTHYTWLGAQTKKKRSIESKKIQDYLSGRGIKWKFFVERAAWLEGFWERLIGSLKTSLKKSFGKSS